MPKTGSCSQLSVVLKYRSVVVVGKHLYVWEKKWKGGKQKKWNFVKNGVNPLKTNFFWLQTLKFRYGPPSLSTREKRNLKVLFGGGGICTIITLSNKIMIFFRSVIASTGRSTRARSPSWSAAMSRSISISRRRTRKRPKTTVFRSVWGGGSKYQRGPILGSHK